MAIKLVGDSHLHWLWQNHSFELGNWDISALTKAGAKMSLATDYAEAVSWGNAVCPDFVVLFIGSNDVDSTKPVVDIVADFSYIHDELITSGCRALLVMKQFTRPRPRVADFETRRVELDIQLEGVKLVHGKTFVYWDWSTRTNRPSSIGPDGIHLRESRRHRQANDLKSAIVNLFRVTGV